MKAAVGSYAIVMLWRASLTTPEWPARRGGRRPLGATATSWDLYALPITLDEQIVGVIELAVRADRTVEAAVLASLPDMCFVLDPEGIVAGCHGSSLSDILEAPIS